MYALLLNFAAPRLKPNFLFLETSMSGNIYRLSREMTISHTDFLRTLSAALNGRAYQVNGNEITMTDGKRRLQIVLSAESQRRFGPIPLPVTHIKLIFTDYSADERGKILEYFDMAYRRGGG
ncbi:MAG: hypothetical protein ACREUI_10295 [Burkholderiales bacterium]